METEDKGKKSVRFAEEDEEHPISPRANFGEKRSVLQGILSAAGMADILDDDTDSILSKEKV